jgi:glycosyltransferase involved in cell wall biosynthesis
MKDIYGLITPGEGSIGLVTEKIYESIGAEKKELESSLPVFQVNHVIHRKIPRYARELEEEETLILPSIDLAAGIKSPVDAEVVVLAHDIHTVMWRNGNFISRKNKLKGLENLSNCDKVVSLSENTAKDIFRYRKNKKLEDVEIKTVTQAFEEGKYYPDNKPPEEIDLPDDYILYAGKLVSRKYPEFLVDVAEETDKDLVIAGRAGEGKKRLKNYIQERNMEDKVHFTGYLSVEDLRRTYSNAGLYLHPALFEGYGRTPVEAAACGTKPIIHEDSGCEPDLPIAETYKEWNLEKVAKLVEENFGEKVEYKPKTWEEFAEEFRQVLEACDENSIY